MLETEDVDEDYFTPTASTTLANIFNKPVAKEENETLKYTAPKPQNVNKTEIKSTVCVFACALQGYEWFNNIYTSKGKLGFAIVKILSNGIHNIILYDSNKTTLSSALVSPKLEVSLKGQNYICYYDDQRKYWSLYGDSEEIKKIVELLKEFDVVIKSVQNEETPPEPDKTDSPHNPKEVKKEQVESVTAVPAVSPKNSKAAILNRMATMGHSVLPPHAGTIKKSTDSETDESDFHIKPVKHKPKGIVKRHVANKVFETNKKSDTPIEYSNEIEKVNTYNVIDHQMLPLPTTSIITSPSGSDMNLFLTEQRISNSEIRMNMTRMTDKVDQVLNKINDLQVRDQTNFQNDIMHKLLKEYESKIKVYEELLNKGVTGTNNQTQPVPSTKADNENALKNRITDLENIIKEKNDYVLSLKNEIQGLKDRSSNNESKQNNSLLELEQELTIKNDEICKLSKEIDNITNTVKNDLDTKIKHIMNETFQAISSNFENSETYSGESIKNLIGAIIKQVTIKSLNELK